VAGDTSSSPNYVDSCLSITFKDPNLLDLQTDEDKLLKLLLQTPSTVVEQITPKYILRTCTITPK
jgi:hypothetical protein